MKRLLDVLDDGTMDTVLRCPDCRKKIRYSDVDRTDETWLEEFSAEHADECEGPEDLSKEKLAELYHSGQWSALYAFLSTGTITEGISAELRSAIRAAQDQQVHEYEILSLQEFLEWADAEEAKKFPTED